MKKNDEPMQTLISMLEGQFRKYVKGWVASATF